MNTSTTHGAPIVPNTVTHTTTARVQLDASTVDEMGIVNNVQTQRGAESVTKTEVRSTRNTQ